MSMIIEEFPISDQTLPRVELAENFVSSSVCESVKTEVACLQAKGFDVALTHTVDVHRPSAARQEMIDAEIARLETSNNGYEEFRDYPALSQWARLTKRAIALKTLYEPHLATVGAGIPEDTYDKPMFDGKSATELMLAQPKLSPEKAQQWIDAYRKFIPAIIDDGTATTLGSRDFFMGVKDAEAARTRAVEAMEVVSARIESMPNLNGRTDLVSASLACGAAGPVYQLVNELGARGHGFSEVILVDQDPMALATADALAQGAGLEGKVNIQLRDLLSENLTDYIAPHSVDVVDLLGLFEYIPNLKDLPMASALLSKVKDIVRPGGIIVFGNMLSDRPQQAFFSKVVKWPRLQQRSITDVLAILEQAGFDANDISVRIPQEGVYAVYAVNIPEVVTAEVSNVSVIKELGVTAVERY